MGKGQYGLATMIVVLATFSIAAPAAVVTWDGEGTDALASNPTNWVGDAIPGSGDDIRLDSSHVGNAQTNITWDGNENGLPDTVASWTQTVDYAGTVTFETTYTNFSTTFTNFTISGDCVISTGTWTHVDNSTVEAYRLYVTVGGDLTLGSNAIITAYALGYDKNWGPGTPPFRTAASHGGIGKGLLDHQELTYGSITNPVNLGSGSQDMPGGGCVMLAVAGNAHLDGTIRVDSVGHDGGSGAGGTINLRANTLSGAGTLNANGGLAKTGGGGGRIAVALTGGDFSSFTGSITAAGGFWSNNLGVFAKGGAGTIYKETPSHATGQGILVVDNNCLPWLATGIKTVGPVGTLMPDSVDLSQFSEIIVTNHGMLVIDGDNTLNFNTVTNIHGGGYLYLGTNWAGVTIPNPLTISGYNLIVNPGTEQVSVTGNWNVASNAGLSHLANLQTEDYHLNLKINGDLTMDGTIDVDLRGYQLYWGPGNQVLASFSAGASYGGVGGNASDGKTYGSVRAPTNIGSGSERGNDPSGGGAVILEVTGATALNGTIRSIGGSGDRGWSSGGSIFLTTANLTGSGTIQANGGSGSFYAWAGGGGGGRVAVVLTSGSITNFTGTLEAKGGSGWTGSPTICQGAAGTVYVNDSSGLDRVVIDNAGNTANAVTELPPRTNAVLNELASVTLILTNQAQVALSDDLTVGYVTLQDSTVSLDLMTNTLTINGITDLDGELFIRPGDYTNNVEGYFDGVAFNGGICRIKGGGVVILVR